MLKILLGAVFCFNFSGLFADQLPEEEWKWTDFEIVGSRSVSREKIISELPVKVGDVYKEDQVQWKKWCADLNTKFEFYFTDCSSVRFLDFRAYFVVSIVEKSQEYRLKYRSQPTDEVAIKDPQIFTSYDQLMARLWQLFDQGISAGENTRGDYLDFKDEKMHDIVLKLVEKSSRSKENLIEIIKSDKNPQKRAKAAWLLNWALTPVESIEKVCPYLDDPITLVRNDVSRFISHWIADVKDKSLQKKLVDALVLQMKRPSHADRNKALSNLHSFLTAVPTLAPYLKGTGGDEIDHIASNSVLENVGGIAKNLQKSMNNN